MVRAVSFLCYNTPMFSFPLETLISSLGYIGIFALMIANGFSTLPSSQALYIITGYFISRGDLTWMPVIVFGAVGNTIGNILLYEATRRHGLKYALKWNMLPEKEIRKLEHVFKKRGAGFLFLGKLIPALKVFVPVAGGLAKTPRPLFTALMLASSIIWAIGFNSLGYFFGKSSDVFGKYALVLVIFAFVILAVIYRKMNSPEVLREIEK